MTECPNCKGQGSYKLLTCPGAVLRDQTCILCDGTGQIGEQRLAWIAAGRVHRDARVARYETQRDAARRLGLDVVALSRMEQGVMDPAPLAQVVQP